MARHASPAGQPFTARERDDIRVAMNMHFGHYPRLAEGMLLRSSRSGPQHRARRNWRQRCRACWREGLVEILPARVDGGRGSPKPASPLRAMTLDCRALDPTRFLQLRAELSLEQANDADA